MKIILAIVTTLFFLVFTLNMAHSSERHHGTINNYYTLDGEVYGVASAISAAQCSFDSSTYDLQLCGAVGYTSDQEAVTFGIGKKYKDFLINGTISSEDNRTSFGASINWKVK